MPHWVLHCDAQLLHGGPVLGSPCEDRTSMAKTATKAAALRVAAPKAIAALDGCSRVAAIAREKDICREREVGVYMIEQWEMLFIGSQCRDDDITKLVYMQ